MDMRTDSQRKGHGAPNHGLQSHDDPILDHFGGTSILENSVCVIHTFIKGRKHRGMCSKKARPNFMPHSSSDHSAAIINFEYLNYVREQ